MQKLIVNDQDTFATTNIDSLRTAMRVASHDFIADEPTSQGGDNAGPSPYDLLAAALASCTSMTLKMYAARKELEVTSISVRVSHGKIHSKDCIECETTAGQVDVFEREIAFSGNLSEQQTTRLLEIADMCPVHRTLHSEVKIRTRLAD